MINIVLIVLMSLYAPIPFFVIALHALVKNGLWTLRRTKILFLLIAVGIWAALFWWFLQMIHLIFFTQQMVTWISIYFGIAALLIAFIIEIASTRALGRKRILGSSEFGKSGDKLITTGIYRYARHPRYVEHPLWFVGFSLILGYDFLWWFALYLFFGFALAAFFEEQELIQRYGDEYLQYRKKTPAFFFGQ